MQNDKITIGISACLLGQKVRFDGGHKRSNFCTDELSRHVEYKHFCPETAVGLPSPRPSLRLVKDKNQLIKICRPDGSGDVTNEMSHFAEKVFPAIEQLSGFVFCAKSPSCGLERVKLYDESGKSLIADGTGVFAAKIRNKFPLLPCEENGRLNDSVIRENFVLRVFAYNHWQQLEASGITKNKLIEFHSQYKYLLMSHDYSFYKKLGNLLGTADLDIQSLAQSYIAGFMLALQKKANRKSHANTLMHLQGYFKKHLSSSQKQEISQAIDAFRIGVIPLFAPLTLLKHYLQEHPNAYLSAQTYFDPYPADLKLRYGY